jgi:hypothetical protein
MKKNILGIAILALISLSILSCKKNKDAEPTTFPIEGTWVGKVSLGSAAPNADVVFLIEQNGTAILGSGTALSASAPSTRSSGTWTLTGNTFKARFTAPSGTVNTLEANFNNTGKLESGTYGLNSSSTGLGTWFANRQN